MWNNCENEHNKISVRFQPRPKMPTCCQFGVVSASHFSALCTLLNAFTKKEMYLNQQSQDQSMSIMEVKQY